MGLPRAHHALWVNLPACYAVLPWPARLSHPISTCACPCRTAPCSGPCRPIPVPRWPSVLAALPVPPLPHPTLCVLSHSSTSLPHVQALPHLTLLRPAQTQPLAWRPLRWGLGDVLGNLCPRAAVACGCAAQQPPAVPCLPTSWALSPAPASWWLIIPVLPPLCPHPPASPTHNSCTAT